MFGGCSPAGTWLVQRPAVGTRFAEVLIVATMSFQLATDFVAALVAIARDKGVSGYIGGGTNRWPAVHRLDSAHLFRLALEKAPAGSTLHAVADEGVPIRDIAEGSASLPDGKTRSERSSDAAMSSAWHAGLKH